jgi:D-alanyl-D-alanine carboxypeptidase
LDPSFRLPSAYAPDDLVPLSRAGLDSEGLPPLSLTAGQFPPLRPGEWRIRALVVPDLRDLVSAASADGYKLHATSGYRSYDDQATTFAQIERERGQAYALRVTARPGHSEHQLGTTIDFGPRSAWPWLRANAHKFGFVLSYPKGKTRLTGYAYEPWHFRYFGRSRAGAIHASRLTAREWLWRNESSA